MSRPVKIFAWLIAGFATLFIVAAVALTLFFDPNDFRDEIADAVEAQTGRTLTIDGDVILTLFPWLAVDVTEVKLGDAPGFGDAPFAELDRANLSVRVLPVILKQEIVVGAAEFMGLKLNLKIDERGNSNWSDLVPEDASEAEADTEVASTSRSIDINRIELIDAMVSYSNAESNEAILLEAVNLRVGRVTSDGSPVPISGSLNYSVDPAGLSGNVEVATDLAFDADTGVVTLDGLEVQGEVAGVASVPSTLRVASEHIEVDTLASRISLQPLLLQLFGLEINADVQPFTYDERVTPIAKITVDAFSPRSVMQRFDIEPPTTADPEVLTRMIVDATAKLTTTAIELTDVLLQLDDTTFSGALSVPRESSGTYSFDLRGDTLALDRYMEPANTDTEASATESVPVEIPVDIIRPLNARGQLQLASASLGDIVFDDIQLGVNSRQGRLRMHPISAQLFGGSYSGDVTINASGNTPRLSVNEKINGVDLAQLAKAMFGQENVSGTIQGAFTLAGSGNDVAAIQNDLSGNMSFELTDGSYVGTDIWYELRRARALLKQEEAPTPQLPAKTDFSTVRATGVVAGGVLRNDDLFAELPHMQLTGRGQVNLPKATVDYGLTARILERPEFLTDASAEELEQFTEAVIPLKITGPLASPSVKPDLESLLRQRVEEEIKDKLEDKLKDLFGR